VVLDGCIDTVGTVSEAAVSVSGGISRNAGSVVSQPLGRASSLGKARGRDGGRCTKDAVRPILQGFC
jgi:hypothetical protein